MAHEQSPGTPGQTQILFSNDAQTLLEIVCPANPLPVTGTATITPVVSTVLTPTQVTVPATANGIIVLAANSARLGATISNPGAVTVFVSSAATGLTTSNGFGIPPGTSWSIDEPLYTGAVYGIVSTGTQVVYTMELT